MSSKSSLFFRFHAQRTLSNFYGDLGSKNLKKTLNLATRDFKSSEIFNQILLNYSLLDFFCGRLESRFDVLAYRMQFASSILEGRQMLRHGFFKLNGYSIPKGRIFAESGDIFSFHSKKSLNRKISNMKIFPNYLCVSLDCLSSGIFLYRPRLSEINFGGDTIFLDFQTFCSF